MKIEQVTKKYQDKVVLKDVSLEIMPRAITSLIGANGAGKSTLLGIMSRLIKPDHGDVLLDGQSISNWKSQALAKRVSILKQANHLTARLTVRDLVDFGRFPYSSGRLTKIDVEKVDEALRYMEMTEMQHVFLDELSGGQKQRAFIAMVIAQDTDYVLLDEPLNNLDMKHAVSMMQIFRKLVDELGKTVVLVLHDINFASCYSDQIVALRDGRKIAEGSTAEMMNEHVLKRVFSMDIPITEVDGNKFGLYFNVKKQINY
ncbi:ferrichrome ABC transporter ATP-binding protein [Listeria floridensis FSL S10-1187]|uniref:Ferrichrome ABC transporter ATP-binding protein n=1 Tax=Listeria floridensis FSL S10-1187 TaxID=1265817 RepID=A0ABN0REI5_9LIST|nr:ATP-binding cassette domain-containing protein [Listeria floridensis]EUJ31249.1 ferrichrome ABC transporter ATP-binding protein [Listeria floridensis FSL S10-1187]